MSAPRAASLIVQYSEYCTSFRVQKSNSAVLDALKRFHEEQRADPRAVLTTLDLSAAYLGPRGLLAVASLATHIRTLNMLNVSNALWFAGDEKTSAPSGNDTVALFCNIIMRHHSLERLVLGECEFGPAQYLWLVELVKKSPRLVSLDFTTPHLREHELFHLECLCKRNRKRAEAIASQFSVGDAQFDDHNGAAALEVEASREITAANASSERALLAFTGRRVGASRDTTKVESLVRTIITPNASDILLGNLDPTSKRLPAPGVPEKTPELLAQLCRYFELNPMLSRVPADVRLMIAKQMRQCFYNHDEIIIEHLDPVDSVALLVTGGAVSQRSDDIAMVHPAGSLLGDEEAMPPTTAETRRFTIRARPSLKPMTMAEVVAMNSLTRKRMAKEVADGVESVSDPTATTARRCEAWFMPRDLFVHHVVRPATEHRARWRRLCDMVPALQVLGITAKLAVADAFEEIHLAPLEVVAAGRNMLNRMFVVVDGSTMVYYRHTEVKKLLRGEIFVCHSATDVAVCSVVAVEKSVVACITEARYQALPLHVQDHIASLAKVYSADDALGTSIFSRRVGDDRGAPSP